MKLDFISLLCLLIFACSTFNDSTIDLDPGQAIVNIENIEYNATAVMDYKTLAGIQFERISLIINDSAKIEILNENFLEGKINWYIEDHVSQQIIFSLQYNCFRGSTYSPLEGSFSVNKRTESIISGEFEITLSGGPYSCIVCPEALRNVKGKFISEIE